MRYACIYLVCQFGFLDHIRMRAFENISCNVVIYLAAIYVTHLLPDFHNFECVACGLHNKWRLFFNPFSSWLMSNEMSRNVEFINWFFIFCFEVKVYKLVIFTVNFKVYFNICIKNHFVIELIVNSVVHWILLNSLCVYIYLS